MGRRIFFNSLFSSKFYWLSKTSKIESLEMYHIKKFAKPIVIISFVFLSIINFIRIDASSHSASDTLRPFVLQTVLLALILYIIYRFIIKKGNPI